MQQFTLKAGQKSLNTNHATNRSAATAPIRFLFQCQ
jgi:hypothetical protein